MTARGLRIVLDEECSLGAPGQVDHTVDVPRAYQPRPAAQPPAIPGQRRGDDPPVRDLAGAAGVGRCAPTAHDREWTARAICALGDPDRLFVTGAAQREAAKLCRGCPVQMECLADALDNQVEFGVWGGLTERQRRALLKRRPDVASWRLVLEQARANAAKPVAS